MKKIFLIITILSSLPVFANSDSCKEVKKLLSGTTGGDVRLDNFDSGTIRNAFTYTKFKKTSDGVFSVAAKLIYPILSDDIMGSILFLVETFAPSKLPFLIRSC